jgi:hypothetical protein
MIAGDGFKIRKQRVKVDLMAKTKGTIENMSNNDIAQADDIEVDVEMFHRLIVITGESDPGGNEVDSVFQQGISAGRQNQLRAVAVIDIHPPVAAVDVGCVPVFINHDRLTF